MALHALASKLRIPAVLCRAPASRSAAPQHNKLCGSTTAPPNPAAEDQRSSFFDEMLIKQSIRAHEKRMMKDLFWYTRIANFAAFCGGCTLFALVYR